VADVLEGLRVLHVMRHQAMLLWWGVRIAWRRAVVVFVLILVAVLLAHEILRTLVFMRAAILRDLSAQLH
jgi:hypothetical protein